VAADLPADGTGSAAARAGETAELASFAQRSMGRGIDLLIVGVLFFMVAGPFIDTSAVDARVPFRAVVVGMVAWIVYETVTVRLLGTTMGKMAVGAVVTDLATGAKPSWAQAGIRAIVVPALVPLVWIFAGVVYSTATIDRTTRRGLLDRLAGTVVVRATPRQPQSPAPTPE
jgi:hypothetical protein